MIDHDVRPPVAEPVGSARHHAGGDGWTGLVLVAAVVAMALVTGLIYTFSVAVMPNLADADDHTFVATMQRFNDNPVFVLTFAGALVLSVLAVVVQRRAQPPTDGPGGAVLWTVAALVLYGIVVAVTAGLHIPLNDDIDEAGDPDLITNLAAVRDDFEGLWVVGNVVRTLLSTAALAALARGLLLYGRGTIDRRVEGRAGAPQWAPPTREGVG